MMKKQTYWGARICAVALLPVLFSGACALETGLEPREVVEGEEVTATAAPLLNGQISVVIIGNSQLKYGPVDLGTALADFSSQVNGGSNAMHVELRQAFVGTCGEYRNPNLVAETGEKKPVDPLDATTDIVVLEPPLLSVPNEPNATSCWTQFKTDANGKEFALLATNTTAAGYYNPSKDSNVQAQGDIVLDDMVRSYAAANGSLYIPAGRYLRSVFGNDPDYNTLASWYSDGAHPNPRAAYAYVTALYQYITGRSGFGASNTLAGMGTPAPSAAEATAIQNFTYQLGGQGPYTAKALNAVVNNDGRVEAIYSSPSDVRFHVWQTTTAGTSWLGERLMGQNENRFKDVKQAQRIVSARDSNGRVQMFFIGLSGTLYRMGQTAATTGSGTAVNWTDPTYLGASWNAGKEIAVVNNDDLSLEVFYIGTDNKLYHNWQNGPSGSWNGESMVGSTSKYAKQFTALRHSDGHIEVYYIGVDDVVYHTWRNGNQANGTWTSESPLGSSSNKGKRITAARNQDNHVEVFYIGTDDTLYHMWWQFTPGAWTSEQVLGSSSDKAKRLAVETNQDGRLELVYISTNNTLYHNYQTSPNGGWSGQGLLGTASNAGLELATGRDANGKIEVIYVGTDNKLYHNHQGSANNGFTGESQL
jgi:hypothetical protein